MAWREKALSERSDLRPVAVEALHVTLVFLGYLPEKEIARTAATAFEPLAGVRAPRLTVRDVKAVPPRNTRLFALDLDDEEGRAGAVQTSVSDMLAAARLYKPEQRAFWPHITFARVKRGEPRPPPIEAPPPEMGPFDTPVVTLYRSHLSPRGARYEALERLHLDS